jgi:hypothetical protein
MHIYFASQAQITLKDIGNLAMQHNLLVHYYLEGRNSCMQLIDYRPSGCLPSFLGSSTTLKNTHALWIWRAVAYDYVGIDLDNNAKYERDKLLQPSSRFSIEYQYGSVEDALTFMRYVLAKYGGWLENEYDVEAYQLDSLDKFKQAVTDVSFDNLMGK